MSGRKKSTIEEAYTKLTNDNASSSNRSSDRNSNRSRTSRSREVNRHVELGRRVDIDLDRLRKRKVYVTGSDKKSMIAISAFKSLRTHMLREMEQRGVNSLLVTGATNDVGKTITAANLAVNMARHEDTYVLLVDLDLRSPSVAELFGLKPDRGVDDVMDDDFELNQAVVQTNIERFSILPCVSAHNNSTELLLSKKMRALFDALRKAEGNLVVIYDGPPLLGCDDISAISSLKDLTLIVVGEGETSRRELKLAMKNLGEESKIAGIVLNKSSAKIFKRYYY